MLNVLAVLSLEILVASDFDKVAGTAICYLQYYLKGCGVLSSPERAGGRAAGQTSAVNTLTSTIFHGSFSNLARTFIALRSRTSSIMEVLPH